MGLYDDLLALFERAKDDRDYGRNPSPEALVANRLVEDLAPLVVDLEPTREFA